MNRQSVPDEVRRFFVSKDFLKEILSSRLEGKVKSLEVDDGKAEIMMPISFLEKAVEDRYKREVESLNLDGGEVELSLETTEETSERNPQTDYKNRSIGGSGEPDQTGNKETKKETQISGAKNENESFSEKDGENTNWRGESLDSDLTQTETGEYNDMGKLERLRKVMRGEE